jgi:S1-C subfamily serine protease
MRFFVILALLIAGCSTLVFRADEALALRRRVAKSVVRVVHETGGGGTGFIVMLSERKIVVTNDHVCDGGDAIRAISDETGESYPLTVIASTPTADLCFSDILGAEALPPLAIGTETPELGTTVYTLGHPLLRNLRLESGQIEAYLPAFDPPAYSTNIFVLPGQSGSPVLDSSLAVVGVIFARDTAETHTAYVIPVEVLNITLDGLKEQLKHAGNTTDN